jgi:hypothetical protein
LASLIDMPKTLWQPGSLNSRDRQVAADLLEEFSKNERYILGRYHSFSESMRSNQSTRRALLCCVVYHLVLNTAMQHCMLEP